MVLSTSFGQFSFLRKLFADTAYVAPVFPDGLVLAFFRLVSTRLTLGKRRNRP